MPKNQIPQESFAHLLTRLVGRPPNHVRRHYVSFSYQTGFWNKKRRVVAKVESHPGELVPRVGFIVTNRSRPAERVLALHNHRGMAEQYVKKGKNAIKWLCLQTGQKCPTPRPGRGSIDFTEDGFDFLTPYPQGADGWRAILEPVV